MGMTKAERQARAAAREKKLVGTWAALTDLEREVLVRVHARGLGQGKDGDWDIGVFVLVGELQLSAADRAAFDMLISKKLVYERKSHGERLCHATVHAVNVLEEARKARPAPR
jgi:hypothetical protein